MAPARRRRRVLEDGSVDEPPAPVLEDASSGVADGALARELELVVAPAPEVEALPPRRRQRPARVLLPRGPVVLHHVGAFDKARGDAPAVLLLVPEARLIQITS